MGQLLPRSRFASFITTIFILSYSLCQAAGRDRTSGTTSDEWDRGTFQNPSINVRPKFRYWAPDAFMDDDRIDFDVDQLHQVGMGGFELICYQLYGDPTPSVYGYEVVDWGKYGFGSTAWKEKTGVFASAAKKYNLNMDFAMGPNQGAGVPVENPDSPGLSTGLEYGFASIKAGKTYSAAAPQPDLGYQPTFNLYWMFRATQVSPATLIGASAGRISRVSGSKIYLDESSMVDLTSQIANGNITFTAPGNGTDDWYIFSFWQRRTGQYEAREGLGGRASNPPASYGSYIVDHFSTTGAKLSTDFIDSYATPPGDFEDVTMYAWEDSMELLSPLYWTDTFMEDFTNLRGYSPVKALPTFFSSYSARTFFFDKPDSGASYAVDYSQTLTDKYIEYMNFFKEWAHSKGLQYSNQPAYNLPLDVTATSAIADAPECESLGFFDSVDAYRQFAGGVHMANARIMSSETGARNNQLYAYTWPQMMFDVRSNWAGGVNQLVFHGSPYSGRYPNTTWPGYTAFIWEGYSGSHNVRQPSWSQYKPIMDHIGRTQFALQAGVPKIDLAIYRYSFVTNVQNIWSDRALWNAGYTWDYLSPANLDLPSANVHDGALSNQGPAYKAFLINNEATMTVDAATHLTSYAEAGLPIIFIGQLPSSTPGNNVTGDSFVKSTIQSLISKKNVLTVAAQSDVVSALSTLGIKPFCGSSFVSVHRWDEDAKIHYVFFYNQNSASTQTVTFQATGTPYLMDTWSGEVQRIASYSEHESTISFQLSLAVNAIALIAIGAPNAFESSGKNLPHALPSNFNGNFSYEGDSLLAKSFQTQNQTITLSDSSTQRQINKDNVLPRQSLNNWDLTVEAWSPTADISDPTQHSTTIHTYNISSLASWDLIDPTLKHVSGIGYYSSRFTWNGSTNDGIILSTGPVFHTMSVTLNGKNLTTLEPYDPWLDITDSVVEGSNLLEIKIATTLQNVLLGLPFEIETSGAFPNPPYSTRAGQEQKYGLLGPVELIPYGIARVRLQ